MCVSLYYIIFFSLRLITRFHFSFNVLGCTSSQKPFLYPQILTLFCLSFFLAQFPKKRFSSPS